MQKNDGVNRFECEASESDWLDISYTQRKYIKEENTLITDDRKKRYMPAGVKKWIKYAAIGCVAFAVVAAMYFVDADSNGNVFHTAREAFTATVTGNKSVITKGMMVDLPPTATIEAVGEDGTITLEGGCIATALTDGTVVSTTDTTVTIAVDEETKMIYSCLTEVLVTVGQEIREFDVLGRYDGTTTVNVLYNDQLVTEVVGGSYSFEWNV